MRIHELGDGTPEVAVVGAIHGDEPCGARAIDRLVDAAPAVERPVKLVVANEEAAARGERYVDEDLNRAFPGDPNADSHERRLAHALKRELRDCTTLAFHSTQSYADPFAIIDTVDPVSRSVCKRLPIELVVETGDRTDGRLIAHARSIEVECGLQGSATAARNAWDVLRHFLAATDVLWTPDDLPPASEGDFADTDSGAVDASASTGDEASASTGEEAPAADAASDGGEPVDAAGGSDGAPDADGAGTADAAGDDGRDVPVFRFGDPIPKPPGERYEVFVDNFTHVPAETRFAAVDGESLHAETDFYPILLSANGYESIFGYAGEHVGTLD